MEQTSDATLKQREGENRSEGFHRKDMAGGVGEKRDRQLCHVVVSCQNRSRPVPEVNSPSRTSSMDYLRKLGQGLDVLDRSPQLEILRTYLINSQKIPTTATKPSVNTSVLM
jgi:hypothetical protein